MKDEILNMKKKLSNVRFVGKEESRRSFHEEKSKDKDMSQLE
jgi:hypothetical protein